MPPYKQSQSQNPTRRRLPLDHLKFKPSPYASNLKVRTPHKDSFYCAKTSPFKSSQIYLCAKIPYFKPTWSTQIQLPGIGNTDSSSLINFEIMCMVTSIDHGTCSKKIINILENMSTKCYMYESVKLICCLTFWSWSTSFILFRKRRKKKKVSKTELDSQTDWQTDWQTQRKTFVNSGETGSGLDLYLICSFFVIVTY